jgi:hypothetical protein
MARQVNIVIGNEFHDRVSATGMKQTLHGE